MTAPRYRPARIGACRSASMEHRGDGAIVLRSLVQLDPYPASLVECLDHWSRVAPDRTFAAKRVGGGLGMTETAPSSMFAVGAAVRSGYVGLPCPGVEVKLVAAADKLEVRFRGPNVMSGHWRAPEQTAEAFDEEGYYCTGDAVRPVDGGDPNAGLMFDGRIVEDSKLSTGTFISVGPLRARVTLDGAPLVQDVVVTAPNREDVGILIFPRVDECCRLAGAGPADPVIDVVHSAPVRASFQALVDRQWRAGTGSANRVARAHVLVEPASIDRGEITEKGSINQRAVLTQRAALIDSIYLGPPSDPWILLPQRTPATLAAPRTRAISEP